MSGDGADLHLTSVITPDGTRWRYCYDPLGRRTAKQRLTADGNVAEETRFTWDGLILCEQTAHQPDAPNTIALTWDPQSAHLDGPAWPFSVSREGRKRGGRSRKLDYLFNKDIKPDTHNSPRALQNELQLHRIEIPDTPECGNT